MKLAVIEKISRIAKHPNADKLEVAFIMGWQAVVQKGAYQEGEKVVFVFIDTVVPRAPWCEFLFKGDEKTARIKTIKLRGQFSQGLVVPLDVLPSRYASAPCGMEVSDLLGVKKYEKPIDISVSGDTAGSFPTQLAAKTDETNGLSDLKLVNEVLSCATIPSVGLSVTRKMDGSSCTVFIEDGKVTKVCSRNLEVKEGESGFWRVAKKMTPENLSVHKSLIVQGELMGPKVQKNQLKLTDYELFVFNVRDLNSNKFFDYADMNLITKELGCQIVPHVAEIRSECTLESLQEMANAQVLPDGSPAEGIVVRPRDYRIAQDRKPMGFKIINQNFGE